MTASAPMASSRRMCSASSTVQAARALPAVARGARRAAARSAGETAAADEAYARAIELSANEAERTALEAQANSRGSFVITPVTPSASSRRSARRRRRSTRRVAARRADRLDEPRGHEPPVRHQARRSARRASAPAATGQAAAHVCRHEGAGSAVTTAACSRAARAGPTSRAAARGSSARSRRGCACTAWRRACARPGRARAGVDDPLLVAGQLEVDVELDAGERAAGEVREALLERRRRPRWRAS